ncbi:MAG TPA: FHA domain-containing serine/threonine-protein kinase [Planctomycetota bacterium]|nr:FHA domain-containing serine/threonine-protein kinase [Planctomycetota bacterium]
MWATVSVQTRAGTTRHEVAPGQVLVLGRGAGCDLRIDEESVSRRHCSVLLRGETLVLEDLESAHGIVRGAERTQRCELFVGDRVRLGGAELCFERLAAPDPAAATRQREAATGGTSAEVTATTVVAEPDPLVGQTLGNYRIVSRLGAGGFATVYRAQQLHLARDVAVKVLRQPASGAQPQALESFLREARAAAALADPRLVAVFDLGCDRGVYFLSMELVTGGSLASRLRDGGPLPWRDVLAIVRDVAGALQVAHDSGLVHRDVKPANILLTEQGRAKLADLGLVRNIGEDHDRAGTAAFMAPEQLRSAPVDGRSDLYALGCTAYAALAGRAPFVGSSKEIVRAQLQDEPPPLPGAAMVPPEFERLIRRELLAKDPDLRPADAAAVLFALKRIEKGGTSRGSVRRAARHRQRAPGGGTGALRVLLVAVVLLAVAGAVYLLRRG